MRVLHSISCPHFSDLGARLRPMKIRRHAPNVYIISSAEPAEVQRFFESLGLEFEAEKHGDGPQHVACERNGVVLEIYPLDPPNVGT